MRSVRRQSQPFGITGLSGPYISGDRTKQNHRNHDTQENNDDHRVHQTKPVDALSSRSDNDQCEYAFCSQDQRCGDNCPIVWPMECRISEASVLVWQWLSVLRTLTLQVTRYVYLMMFEVSSLRNRSLLSADHSQSKSAVWSPPILHVVKAPSIRYYNWLTS